ILFKGEPEDFFFRADNPPLPIQVLKLFSKSYIVLRKGDLPSQHTVVNTLSCFISEWEKITSKKILKAQRDDAYNHVRTVLTPKYGLSTKHRKRYPVTNLDLNILLMHLYKKDKHDYLYKRSRFQDAFGLALFTLSGARAGAIVESSSYRNSDEALYYEHLLLNIRWNASRQRIKYWATISSEFLKGNCYNNKAV
ncbi:hypothetical protein BJX63DRAFT_414802, partial [Aspergillus granulosus]